MRFESALIAGTLIRRYQRFLADVVLEDGTELTAHTPNTGSMMGCAEPGMRVWLPDSGNSKRKYRMSWELVEAEPGVRVGINTQRANRLVEEAIGAGLIPSLAGFDALRREVRYGESSRIDLLLERARERCFVEVKNVTAAVTDGLAMFPDAVSVRASKHAQEMRRMVEAGDRAALVFCVQREDVLEVRPADEIDPVYGQTLRRAVAAGVEVHALGARVDDSGIELVRSLPVRLA